ncbi:MAG TPA: hypothetical protein VI643_04150 [Planctomycetota bacterium]|nr:hypothetical protein [Planctomycetota bacterium]
MADGRGGFAGSDPAMKFELEAGGAGVASVRNMTEIEEIRSKYQRGELDHIRRDLENFITSHREEILAFQLDYNAKNPRRTLNDALAIKFYLIQVRSINPQQEIREQLNEIEKEKWIRGVASGHAPDANEVAMEWARLYSPGWRSHRVTAIIFIFEQERERFAALLRQCPA